MIIVGNIDKEVMNIAKIVTIRNRVRVLAIKSIMEMWKEWIKKEK